MVLYCQKNTEKLIRASILDFTAVPTIPFNIVSSSLYARYKTAFFYEYLYRISNEVFINRTDISTLKELSFSKGFSLD